MRRGGVSVDAGFLLLLASLCVVGGVKFTLCLLIAAAVHEAGHLLTLIALGGELLGIRLSICGAEINSSSVGYTREAIAAAAGPVVSIICACAASALNFDLFAGVSLLLGIFNFLPLSLLDGGRIMSCLMLMRFSPALVSNVSAVADAVIYSSLAAIYVYIIITKGWSILPFIPITTLALNTASCKKLKIRL